MADESFENGTEAQDQGGRKYDPSAFLAEINGKSVTVKLNNGIVYKGNLQNVDGYMNIALEHTREVINGKPGKNYGDTFIRGNNVQYISAD
ncbi:LSM-domain-containing protein [Aulographum hederae CBS 113979]|uniref:U6 snRNA-associated Sm-like protein LSm6 n=1 Tax=Aulographum hederae CBS 113979 TaxID=1176131 RepID=A0A6G1GV03_9PEZI|nr:LSM-domain-containing protein [Aulographum hederae CBS 113979]